MAGIQYVLEANSYFFCTHSHTKVQNATHQEHLGVSWAEKGHPFPWGPWRILAWKNLGWRKPRHAETLRNQIEVEVRFWKWWWKNRSLWGRPVFGTAYPNGKLPATTIVQIEYP